MPLVPGSRIGAHVVLSLIGEGGMGEVYRARDTTLDRDVAIKRLPDGVANNPERLARFEREAKALAALNHPNVAQIYAVEVGTLVMELVPGSPLRGPLPLETVLDYAGQIASALEAAHDKGIVHRDLKPGNVMVTPDGVIKVLDFGLAAREPASPPSDPSQSPTLTAPISAGMILGTAAYMAPEQASGKAVDKRADIFAFGVVVWELLTGRRMFEGETVSHVLAAVLTQEPDLTAVPPRVRHLLARCLEKDPRKRLRDIGDAMSLVLPATTDAAGVAAPRPNRALTMSGWVAAAIVGATALVVWPRSADVDSTDMPVARFSIARTLDLYAQTASAFAVSPDGIKLAYYDQATDGRFALMVRTLATGEVTELTGAGRVFGPRPDSLAWSPDGQQLASAVQGGVAVIDVATGASRQLCDCRVVGLNWNQDGTILMGGFGSVLGIRRASLGEPPAAVTTPLAERGELDRWPVFLPDGRRFLFTRTSGGADGIYLGSFDGAEPRRLGEGSARAVMPAPQGHLLIGIDGTGAWSRPFDIDSPAVTGAAQVLVAGAASISLSRNGVLASSVAGTRPRTIPTWFDRSGAVQGTIGAGGYFESMSLSNDGRVLAVAEGVSGGQGRHDIWALDVVTGIKNRLTFYEGNDSTPVLSPDRRRIVYSSIRGRARLFQRSTDGTGDETPFFDHDGDVYANDWSSDGRAVLYTLGLTSSPTVNDLWVAPVAAGVAGTPVPYLVAPGRQQQGRFSPDGRFVAFGDDQSGAFEIYVRPFPDASKGKWMVSTGGGTEPRWSRDGKELFYFSGQALMAVPVSLSPTFSFGTPVKLFDAPIPSGYTNESDIWQVAPDGRRFLFLPLAGPQPGPPLEVIVNWPLLLKN